MTNSVRESRSGFGAGFVSAVIFLAVLAGAVRLAQWVGSHPMPEALIAWLTAPRISVLGLLNITLFLVIGYAVLWTLAHGPRMR